MSFIKIAWIFLLGITLNGTVQAENDKLTRSPQLAFGKMTQLVEAIVEGIRNSEIVSVKPVEDWMLDSQYLSEESANAVESWMLESDYLKNESQSIESWMLSESRLSEDSAEPALKPWMFDSEYLYAPQISRSSVR